MGEEWTSRSDSSGDIPAIELIRRSAEVRRIHPAQGYLDGKLYYGYPAPGESLFMSSQRKVLKARDLPEGVMPEDRGLNLCRFSKDGIPAFTSGTDVAGYQLLRDLEAFLR
jgi:hypothetical protein